MSFWKRIFSADFRAAVSAEAAGHLEQAAEHYVLAGEHAEAARVHLARAERAEGRAAEIDALRDALHWAGNHPEVGMRIKRALGRALLARVRAEGIATARDQQRVREAAALLMAGGDYAHAGEALESIDDVQGAVAAYSEGGLVERMEEVLASEDQRSRRESSLREAFANYELHMRMGARDEALAQLRTCIEIAERKADYRHLVSELEARLITGGKVVLQPRGHSAVIICAATEVTIGRDPLCDMPLRATGVSRRHVGIEVGPAGSKSRFHLRDLGSRNGTQLAGMAITGRLPLGSDTSFSLGDDCEIACDMVEPGPLLVLRAMRGLDEGRVLVAMGEDEAVDLELILSLPLAIRVRKGRPFLRCTAADGHLLVGGEAVAHGEVQLIHGDSLMINGNEVEVV